MHIRNVAVLKLRHARPQSRATVLENGTAALPPLPTQPAATLLETSQPLSCDALSRILILPNAPKFNTISQKSDISCKRTRDLPL